MKPDIIGDHKCTLKNNLLLTQTPYTEDLPPTATYTQKFFRLIRSCFLVSRHHRSTKVYLGSEAAFIKERRRQIDSKYGFMIHPFSLFILTWQFSILNLWIVDLLLIPYTIFLNDDEQTSISKFVVVCDGIACIDIMVKFFTASYNPVTKEIVFNLPHTATNYTSNNFAIDLIGSLPLQVMVEPMRKKSLRETMYFLKILRAHCLMVYLEAIFFQLNTNFKPQYRINIILKSLVFVQFATAFYFQSARTIHLIKDDEYVWIIREKIHEESTPVWTRYRTTLFFVTGFLTTSGESNRYPGSYEESFIIVLITFGGYMFLSYLIVTVYCLYTYTYNDELQYNAKLTELRNYMTKKSISPELQNKIYTYVNYIWEGKYFDEEKIMNTLSKILKLEIKLYDCEKLIFAVPFFWKLPKNMLMDIVEYLHLEIYLPGEIIIEAGTIVTTMYFLKCGSVSIRTSTGKEIFNLKDGSYFGESCITEADSFSKESAISMEISEIYQLKLEDWQRCIKLYPQVKELFE